MSRDLDPALVERVAQALTGNGTGEGFVWTLDEAEPIARAVLTAVADDLRLEGTQDDAAQPTVNDPARVVRVMADAIHDEDCLHGPAYGACVDKAHEALDALLASGVVQDAAAVAARARREALTEAASEMEIAIAEGDVAEVAAPVPGEVNRHKVIDRRDALYEDPATWLRDMAAREAAADREASDG